MHKVDLILVVLTIALAIIGLGLGSAASGADASRRANAAFVGGRVVAADGEGGFIETRFTVDDLVNAAAPATRATAHVLTTGAAALNVTVEVLRIAALRSWVITTTVPANVTTTGTIVVPLSGKGVLLVTDTPVLESAALDGAYDVPCTYTHSGSGNTHRCTMYVHVANASLTVVPDKLQSIGTAPVPDATGFGSYHVGNDVTLSARFHWIAREVA